jgi:hypothetical protein
MTEYVVDYIFCPRVDRESPMANLWVHVDGRLVLFRKRGGEVFCLEDDAEDGRPLTEQEQEYVERLWAFYRLTGDTKEFPAMTL